MGLFNEIRGIAMDITKSNGQNYIENSKQNVARRLDFLRYTPDYDSSALYRKDYVIDEKVLELPRKIEFNLDKIVAAIQRDAYDVFHYQITHDDKKQMISSQDYYNEHGNIDSVFAGSCSKYLNRQIGQVNQSTVVPRTEYQVTSFEMPKDMNEVLRIPKASLKSNFDTMLWHCLNRDIWNGKLTYQDEALSAAKAEQLAEAFLVIASVKVDVRINGIEAEKYNLTYTEQQQIISSIRKGNIKGEFLSDGIELADDVPTNIFDKYESKLRDSMEMNHWYMCRDEAIKNTTNTKKSLKEVISIAYSSENTNNNKEEIKTYGKDM